MDVVKALLGAVLVPFVALFRILNPRESAPLYHLLTTRLFTTRQRAKARKVAGGGLALLLGPMLLGP